MTVGVEGTGVYGAGIEGDVNYAEYEVRNRVMESLRFATCAEDEDVVQHKNVALFVVHSGEETQRHKGQIVDHERFRPANATQVHFIEKKALCIKHTVGKLR